eukprot:gnl/MRDRNA2_/MRDRNA2_28104_c0_seq1.p1 gnl/MRDRNA2_/MRDRNA2_28104_c0~~gnl/MRDRNA2_/MRDRNA2_28104_c0_seq1.p1  ORF type:complete len:441 (-),score=93.76 gnl/MRDRNA2_/MRDRNA2_28104_c0_seq1:96-1364(-)
MAPSELAAWRSPHDRVSFKELQAHYAQPLQQLGQKFEAAFAAHPRADPEIHDDIFILKHLLSKKGDTAATASSIQQALDWRKENLPIIQAAADLKAPPNISKEGLQAVNCYMAAGVHCLTSYGDVVVVIRAACVNFAELVKDLDSLEAYIMYLWEVCAQHCDTESRKRQHFCKLFVINDMIGFSPNPLLMKKFGAVMGAQSKRSEFLYPQFLGIFCPVNAPAILQFIFKLISPLLSKGFVDKFKPHGALTPDPSRIVAKELPLPFKGDDAACMPTFLGGRCERCVGFNFPNVLPPPPQKTPADLASTASLTNFVQVKYLQTLREEAATAKSSSSSTAATATPVPSVEESMTASDPEVVKKEEQAQNQVKAEADQPAQVPHNIPSKESSISKSPAVPVDNTDIQIETEPKTPELPRKGWLGCC